MKQLAPIVTLLILLGGLPLVFVAGFACREKDEPCLTCPPPSVQTIFLDTVYTEPTEVGVRVQMTDSLGTSAVQLFRDTTMIFSQRVLATDTTIVDDSLLPARTYHYKVYRLTNGQRVDSSNVLTARTMDTSSHNFTWEIDTLGDGNSSVLYDCAIINDTLAYAVGEIYKRDSTGNFEAQPYNLLRWNGVTWKLYKISFPTYGFGCTYAGFSSGAIKTVFSFEQKSILISDGAQIAKWNGDTAIYYPCVDPFQMLSGEILKLWGTSENSFYVVGRNGTILHYEFGTWQKLESGTDVDLLDVWGTPDGSTVWACGWEDFKPTVLLKLQNGVWEKAYEDYAHRFIIREDSLSGNLSSGFSTFPRKLFLLSDGGLYKAVHDTRGAAKRISFPPTWSGFPWRVRGNALNDLIIVGEYYMIGHYNGFTLRHYSELRGYGRLRSVSQKGNLAVAVGVSFDSINRYAIVFKGRR